MPTCLLRTVVPNDKKLARNRFITVCSMWFHKFFQPNFHNFRFRWLLALHFQNLSNFCSQFHRGFFNLIFGGIFAIRPNCTTPRAFEPFSGSQLGFCRPLDEFYCYSVLRPKPSSKIGSLDKALLFWYWQQLNKYFSFLEFFFSI